MSSPQSNWKGPKPDEKAKEFNCIKKPQGHIRPLRAAGATFRAPASRKRVKHDSVSQQQPLRKKARKRVLLLSAPATVSEPLTNFNAASACGEAPDHVIQDIKKGMSNPTNVNSRPSGVIGRISSYQGTPSMTRLGKRTVLVDLVTPRPDLEGFIVGGRINLKSIDKPIPALMSFTNPHSMELMLCHRDGTAAIPNDEVEIWTEGELKPLRRFRKDVDLSKLNMQLNTDLLVARNLCSRKNGSVAPSDAQLLLQLWVSTVGQPLHSKRL
uniref:Uncharacterized protein n=1 Tax=Lotharella globosa TaxID=91324 RepID=A0A7S3ZDP5_9EUKA